MSPPSDSPIVTRPRRLRGLALLPALVLAALGPIAGCTSTRNTLRVHPVSAAAVAALEEARSWNRAVLPEDRPAARERARAAAERALALAPGWVAPRRLLDDFLLEDLLGIEALQAHREALERDPRDAAETYLAGRLEGAQGVRRFEYATRLDPDLAWGWHGLAWDAARRRDHRLAQAHQRKAIARARGPFERTFFTAALARHYLADDEPKIALELLEARLAAPDLAVSDHDELSVQAALIELSMLFQPEYKRGWERALTLLRERDLTDREVEDLVKRLRVFRVGNGESLELQLALASRKTPARDRWRAKLMLESRSTPLALGLLRRAEEAGGGRLDDRPLLRDARFAAGQFALGVEEWREGLPAFLLDDAGLPRDERLARLVLTGRELGPTPAPELLARFGEELLAAGWFSEARSVASQVAVHDLDAALGLEDRAASGSDLLAGMRRLMQGLDERRGGSGLSLGALGGSLSPDLLADTGGANPRGLREVLAALAPLVARAHDQLGGETDARRVAEELVRTPVLGYASFASVLHPGPRFSPADERAGRGTAGESVPGLAEVLDRLGRFGVFGQVVGGGGPDGTLLRKVLAEEREGEHLGVAWSGTVVWCEGADLLSRAGRQGADIAGAALHEGYWIDIDAARRQLVAWHEARRRFFPDGVGSERVERALSSRGMNLVTSPVRTEVRRAERRDIATLLGQADRVRLAVLRDRARSDSPTVDLEEIVRVTAIHEEGHLCDRARFLPLSRNLPGVLKLLLRTGLSPRSISERLEYRAELVALCEAPDPRVTLVSILEAAEGAPGGGGVTSHAGAYAELLADLILVLDRELERRPEDWPGLDADHVLAHQLHHLEPVELRKLARKLARREGLFAD